LNVDEAWDDVLSFLAWEPQKIDRDLLLAARETQRRYSIGWWDSLIVGAAQLQNCAVLLTEDLQDGMLFGSVTIRNPFKMKVEEVVAGYDTAAAAISRHPRRGRPQKMAKKSPTSTRKTSKAPV
jgi:hypothetical protein